jgi:hypothetical protein
LVPNDAPWRIRCFSAPLRLSSFAPGSVKGLMKRCNHLTLGPKSVSFL